MKIEFPLDMNAECREYKLYVCVAYMSRIL